MSDGGGSGESGRQKSDNPTRTDEQLANLAGTSRDTIRKGFTKSERVDYIKRLLRIEQAKAKERQTSGTSVENSTEVGRSDEITAAAFGMKKDTMRRNFTGSELADGLRRQMEIEQEKAQQRIDEARRRNGSGKVSMANGTARDKAGEAFGISGKQAEKVLYVADNAGLLDPAEFAKWDEGKLSTNKAYQRIGEILRELPKGKGNQYQTSASVGVPTKAQAEREAHIDHHTSIDLQALAANPDVVQAVLDKAEAPIS